MNLSAQSFLRLLSTLTIVTALIVSICLSYKVCLPFIFVGLLLLAFSYFPDKFELNDCLSLNWSILFITIPSVFFIGTVGQRLTSYAPPIFKLSDQELSYGFIGVAIASFFGIVIELFSKSIVPESSSKYRGPVFLMSGFGIFLGGLLGLVFSF